MKTLLYPNLYLTSLVTRVETELRRSFTVSLAFSLLPEDAGQPVEPMSAWMALGLALPEGCVADLGLPKQTAEWLMAGQAIVPAGMRRIGLPVDVRVGGMERGFIAGEADDKLAAAEAGRRIALPMPTADLAHDRSGANAQHRASPLPIPMADKPMTGLGTFDELWLKKYWPGPPQDFNWHWYNLGQREQWAAEPFSGLENVRITNMHESHPVLSASLPGQRLRLFADYGTEEKNDWRELPAQADTLWLLPNSGCAILLWHVTAPTTDERSTDIREVAACLEPASGPRQSAEKLIAETRQALAPPAPPAPPAPEPAPVATVAEEPKPAPPMPKLPPVAAATPAPAAPPAPVAPPPPPAEPSNAEMVEQMFAVDEGEIKELVGMANEALAQHGLPPITVNDVKAQLAKQKRNTLDILNKADKLDQNKMLADAGFDQKAMDDLLKATELPIPSRASFASQEAYDQALMLYGQKFAALTKAPKDVTERMLTNLRSMEAKSDEEMLKILGVPPLDTSPAGLAAELAKKGYKADANALESAIELFASSNGDAGTLKAAEALATAMGGSASEAGAVFKSTLGMARAQIYDSEEVTELLQKVAAEHPGQKAAIARLGALVKDPPMDELFDLHSLALRAGLSDRTALDKIAAGDPLPSLSETEEPTVADGPAVAGAAGVSGMEEPARQAAGAGARAGLADVADAGHDVASADAEPAAELAVQDRPSQDVATNGATGEAEEPGQTTISASAVPSAPDISAILAGGKLAGLDLAGLSLAGAILAGADLTGTDLSGTDLAGANLAGANLRGAKLGKASLRGADLTGADLTDADLGGADATDATFDQCLFAATRLEGLKADKASFVGITANGQDFANASLDRCNFQQAGLEQAVFARASLPVATFEQCRLGQADFSGARMAGCRMYDNELSGANFQKADLADSSWLRCSGSDVCLNGASLGRAILEECGLAGAGLTAIVARQCRFLSCNLHGAHLEEADLMNGSLRDSKLGDARLDGASLYGADLYLAAVNSGTSMTGADLHQTCLTRGMA